MKKIELSEGEKTQKSLRAMHFDIVFRVKVLECSAKDDINVTELFRSIVTLSRVLHIEGGDESTSGLKRRSSAYVSATSKGLCF